MIAKAKKQERFLKDQGLENFAKSLEKESIKRNPRRKSKKDITKKDIEMIEALGGSIEDLLK